jgi:hypothetical protein
LGTCNSFPYHTFKLNLIFFCILKQNKNPFIALFKNYVIFFKEGDIDKDISLPKNDIDKDISLAKNDIDRYISLAENDIDKNMSLAKNYIDREGIFEEAKRGFVILDTVSSLLLTLSVNNMSNQREGLCL